MLFHCLLWQLNNLRSISILPAITKLFERLKYNCMLSFINKYLLLIFGFRRSCNTELATLRIIDYITSSLNFGKPSLGYFIDISKAFNSINRTIFLDKLFYLGFRGVVYSTFSSYCLIAFKRLNLIRSSLILVKYQWFPTRVHRRTITFSNLHQCHLKYSR